MLPGDSIITGVFWDKEGHFQVPEPGMKVFGQRPALMGQGTGWARVSPGSCGVCLVTGAGYCPGEGLFWTCC